MQVTCSGLYGVGLAATSGDLKFDHVRAEYSLSLFLLCFYNYHHSNLAQRVWEFQSRDRLRLLSPRMGWI
jgi:hypothetical protein